MALFAVCILNHIKNSGNGGIAVSLCGFDSEQAVRINGAGINLIACGNGSRYALARKSRGVNLCAAAFNNAVKLDFFAGINRENIAGFNFLGVNINQFAAFFNMHLLRRGLNHIRNGFAAFANRQILQKFAYCVKQHNRAALGIFADCKSAD